MEIIRKVLLHKGTGQRFVTIPMAQIDIQRGDYVVVKKYKTEKK